MVDRKEVQAGDDALGADDDVGQQDAQAQVMDASLGALTPEEEAQFAEMQANSGRPAEIVNEGDADDAQAAADKAATAAKTDGQQQAAEQDGDDDDDDQGGDQQRAAGDGDDDKVDPTQGGRFPQRVNYRKFKRAQERAEKAEKELAAEREKSTRIDERIKLLTEAMQQQPSKQQEDQQQDDEDELGPMPDPDKDIFAFAAWQAKKNVQLERQLAGVTTHVVGREADQTLERTYMADIQSIARTTPDFNEAYRHLMATRLRQLSIQQFDVDPMEEGAQLTKQQYDQLAAAVTNEERRLVGDAIKKGRSPAMVIYNLARTFGYVKAAPPQEEQKDQQQQNGGSAKPGNGAAQQQQQNGQRRSPVSDAVAAARRGAETNKSLSDGGGAPEGQLTAEQVLTMDEADFARFMNTATPDQIRQVLGQ